ncbi:ABC transporter substrate-binding protein [Microbacterium sp. MPKO10]|uniref:ABC transporter substrate-binding protein n=1 Tax=Microbacterium sp. MPKO10 TaxID=2989818 RepID=UPI0022365243|nr:ABC transporter substrate-binding protein [Microbacterium sp. MPKO10]MCW4457299.1 ABC transporter substrate-binding protein [Microbacterium sp. MPKO10]
MKFSNKKAFRAQSVCLIAMTASLALGVSACTPSSAQSEGKDDAAESVQLGISDDDYSLDKLIEAAKKEGPLTVSDSTGKIKDIAKNFTSEYGIETTGVKMKAGDAQEVAIRESEAGNIKTDVFILGDAPAAQSVLIKRGITSTWTPPDLADTIPADSQDPQVITTSVLAWAYNTEKYGEECPITNLWALTTDKWNGQIVLEDPTLKTAILYWANQVADHDDDEMVTAYEDFFGEDFASEEDSAVAEWLKRIAGNNPLLVKSDGDAADAVGAPGQTEPFMGLMSTAKFRENEDSGYKLGLCKHIAPISAIGYTKVGLIANGTESPNAAKLFLHYMLTEDGIAPQVADGKFSSNPDVPLDPTEPSGIADIWDEVHVPDRSTLDSDFSALPDWIDFWTINSHK